MRRSVEEEKKGTGAKREKKTRFLKIELDYNAAVGKDGDKIWKRVTLCIQMGSPPEKFTYIIN